MDSLIYLAELLHELPANAMRAVFLALFIEAGRIFSLFLICFAFLHYTYRFLSLLEKRKRIVELTGEDRLALRDLKEIIHSRFATGGQSSSEHKESR